MIKLSGNLWVMSKVSEYADIYVFIDIGEIISHMVIRDRKHDVKVMGTAVAIASYQEKSAITEKDPSMIYTVGRCNVREYSKSYYVDIFFEIVGGVKR